MNKIYILLITLMCLINYSEAQFTEFPTPVSNALYSGSTSYYPYGQTFWVCGTGGTVYHARGYQYPMVWINAHGNLSNTVNLYSLEAIDSSTAFVAGNIGTTTYIYKTTNAGSNWVQQFSQANGQLNSVWMRNATTGFAEGNPVSGRWSLWRTTNGGSTWDSTGRYLPASGNETGFANSMWCKGDTILFGTNNSRIYFSSNYGLSWIVKSTSPEVNIISLHYTFYQFIYPLSFWAAGFELCFEFNQFRYQLDRIPKPSRFWCYNGSL